MVRRWDCINFVDRLTRLQAHYMTTYRRAKFNMASSEAALVFRAQEPAL